MLIRNLKGLLKVPAHIFTHVVIIVISAAIALTLPYTTYYLANKFLYYWDRIGNEKIFLLIIEIVLAFLLILVLNSIGRGWKDRRLARMAKTAGLVLADPEKGPLSRRQNRRLKESQGIARDILVMGSTGYRTFTDEAGDLHKTMQDCRGAKILLLNPFSEGALIRSRSISSPEITPERLREQIRCSIRYLKELKEFQKDIRLKLYSDAPFLKMIISGDYLWLRQYHAGIDVKVMPEFVFRHNQHPGSLYSSFYQSFLKKWKDPGIPEYDFGTDELVYRNAMGKEERREQFTAEDGEALVSRVC